MVGVSQHGVTLCGQACGSSPLNRSPFHQRKTRSKSNVRRFAMQSTNSRATEWPRWPSPVSSNRRSTTASRRCRLRLHRMHEKHMNVDRFQCLASRSRPFVDSAGLGLYPASVLTHHIRGPPRSKGTDYHAHLKDNSYLPRSPPPLDDSPRRRSERLSDTLGQSV